MKRGWWIPLIFIVAACSPQQPSVGMIQTAIAETQTAALPQTHQPGITNFPSPTDTASKTSVPDITNTITPSKTPRPTFTVTATTTETPPPRTATAISINATHTARVVNRTATSVAAIATATELAAYTRVTSRELASYPGDYIGKKISTRGWVNSIDGNNKIILSVGYTGKYLIVEMSQPFKDIYIGQVIEAYGLFRGETCSTSTIGDEECFQGVCINVEIPLWTFPSCYLVMVNGFYKK